MCELLRLERELHTKCFGELINYFTRMFTRKRDFSQLKRDVSGLILTLFRLKLGWNISLLCKPALLFVFFLVGEAL